MISNKKVNGHLILNNECVVEFIEEVEKVKIAITKNQTCPKCQQGSLIQGKTAWGCNRFKEGCDYRVPFVAS